MKLYVEGGGDATSLRTECRKAFTDFIKKSGVSKRPRVVACGSRRNAYESYCTAINNGEKAFLLVDAEEPIAAACQQGNPDSWKPWDHLNARCGDNWEKPANAQDIECHLMALVMESWFIADRSALSQFFGASFKDTKLPPAASAVEGLTKDTIYKSLKYATKVCKPKGQYGKGAHSFEILSEISPAVVIGASPWAKRFLDELRKEMDL